MDENEIETIWQGLKDQYEEKGVKTIRILIVLAFVIIFVLAFVFRGEGTCVLDPNAAEHGEMVFVEHEEPSEPEESEYLVGVPKPTCVHGRLEIVSDFWGLASIVKASGRGSYTHGEYRCLDCGWDVVIVSAVAIKPKKEPQEPCEPNEQKAEPDDLFTDVPEHMILKHEEPPEPNEPKVDYSYIHLIADPNWEWSKCSKCSKKVHIAEGHYCLMQFIPTWPDYLELEKTLHLYWENPNPDPNISWNIDDEWIIGKGTKIYFKDD